MPTPLDDLLASLRRHGWQEDDFGDYYRGEFRVRISRDGREALVEDCRVRNPVTLEIVGARAWVLEKSREPLG